MAMLAILAYFMLPLFWLVIWVGAAVVYSLAGIGFWGGVIFNDALLVDEDAQVSTAYGAWGERSMYGRKYMGILRSAFLIDEKGKIAEAWYKISPADTLTAPVLGPIMGGWMCERIPEA